MKTPDELHRYAPAFELLLLRLGLTARRATDHL